MIPVPCLLPGLLALAPSAPASVAAYLDQVAGQGQAPENGSRTFYLYALAMITDWPETAFPDAAAPFTIAVYGHAALDAEAFQGRTAKGRRIRVLRTQGLQDLGRAHLVFIGQDASSDLPIVLRAVRGRPVLVVGEQEDFTLQGGIVRCSADERSVPLEVNVRAAREAGLTFRAQFLKMVRRVAY